MKKILLTSALATLLLSSCQNSQEAQNRHEEMKQILTVYNKNSSTELELQKQNIADLQKKIESLTTKLTATETKVKNLSSGEYKDAVQATLSLNKIPNKYIKRSLITILSELNGKAAEEGIIQIIRENTDSSTISSGMSALKKINSRQIKPLCFELLEINTASISRYALQYLSEIMTKEDLPQLHKVAARLPKSSSSYDVRYCWTYLLKCYLSQGDETCVKPSMEVLENINVKSLTSAAWAALVVAKYGTDAEIKKVTKILSPMITPNSSLDSDVNYWLRENSHVKMYPVMQVLLKKHKEGSSYRNYTFQAYASWVQPIAAAALVKEYNESKNSSLKSTLIKTFQNGYPGIMWFDKDKRAELIPADELQKMIKDFE